MIDASAYNKCVRCGLCLPSCPTYLETMTETSGPRGRISLIRAVAEGNLEPLSAGFTQQMAQCLDCRACAAACPSGVDYGSLVEGARARIEQERRPSRSPVQRFFRFLAYDLLFRNLAVMRLAAALLRFYQRSGLQSLMRRSGVLRALNLHDAEALAPRISDRFLIARGQRFDAPASEGLIALHTGCVMHVAFAHVHEATVRVLRRNHLSTVLPKGQGCCGAIAVHAGATELGRELARKNIAAFESSGARYYVVNAAGCGAALKEYARWLENDPQWSERAAAFTASVRDVLELLGERECTSIDRPLTEPVTYQEPCHLVHAQGIASAPRRILDAIAPGRLVEMEESSLCCGSAGLYNLTQPAMSAQLGRRKAQNAVRTGARIVATANPGCAMQLAAYLPSGVAVKHIIELLDEAYA